MSFLNSGPAGYFNAPMSKLILLLVLGFNVFGAMVGARRGGSYVMGYTSQVLKNLINPLQWWRLFTGPFIFSSIGELFFGVILLYVFRVFERLWGTQKFSVFVVLSFVSTFFFQLGLNTLLLPLRSNQPLVWSGPYGLIFACLVQYLFDIPAMSKFQVYRVAITEKHITLILCAQLMLANFPYSFIAAIAGIMSGLLYRFEPLRLSQLHLFMPRFLVNFSTKYIYPLVNSDPPQRRRRRNQNTFQNIQQQLANRQGAADQGADGAAARGADDPNFQGYADNLMGNNDTTQQFINRGGAGAANGNTNDQINNILRNFYTAYQQQQQQAQQPQQPAARQQVQPSEENLQMLEDMGYDRQRARNALVAANNNVEHAVDILLAQS